MNINHKHRLQQLEQRIPAARHTVRSEESKNFDAAMRLLESEERIELMRRAGAAFDLVDTLPPDHNDLRDCTREQRDEIRDVSRTILRMRRGLPRIDTRGFTPQERENVRTVANTVLKMRRIPI